MHTLQKSYYIANCTSETKASLADWAFQHYLTNISDDDVATEQLTAVVDVRFMLHNNPEIS